MVQSPHYRWLPMLLRIARILQWSYDSQQTKSMARSLARCISHYPPTNNSSNVNLRSGNDDDLLTCVNGYAKLATDVAPSCTYISCRRDIVVSYIQSHGYVRVCHTHGRGPECLAKKSTRGSGPLSLFWERLSIFFTIIFIFFLIIFICSSFFLIKPSIIVMRIEFCCSSRLKRELFMDYWLL